jgi:hypothetical protein
MGLNAKNYILDRGAKSVLFALAGPCGFMNVNSRRLSILTKREIDDLYGLPRFSYEDRCLYFDLSADEKSAVDEVHTSSAAVHLTLQLGYFKAKWQFFVYELEDVLDDLDYILQKYFPGKELTTIKDLSKPTRLEQQRIILQLFDFRICGGIAKAELEHKAQRVAMLSALLNKSVFQHSSWLYGIILGLLLHPQ